MTSKKIFGALGLAAVLGVAGIAATGAHADVNVTYEATVLQGVSISIPGSDPDGSGNYSRTISVSVNGGSHTTDSSLTLNVGSNATNGYTVTALADSSTNLVNGSNTIAYSTSSDVATGDAVGWNLSVGSTVLSLSTSTPATVASSSSASADTVTVVFAVSTASNQAQGTYTGQVTYTIAAGN